MEKSINRKALPIALALSAIGGGVIHAQELTPAQATEDNHSMGSQVRLHEGNQLQLNISADVLAAATGSVAGMDVSSFQGNVNWSGAFSNGARFAYVKATESTDYINPFFAQQYDGSFNVGMIRGAYHFAHPNATSGAAQADYFVDHGGGWSADGKTLPGTLDIEYNPNGATCYGLSQSAMAAWITSFSNEYHSRTTRWPVIYTTTNWWSQCVGTAANFSNNSPIWVADFNSTVGPLPFPWGFYTFWQFADSGKLPGDQDVFNGASDRLQALAD